MLFVSAKYSVIWNCIVPQDYPLSLNRDAHYRPGWVKAAAAPGRAAAGAGRAAPLAGLDGRMARLGGCLAWHGERLTWPRLGMPRKVHGGLKQGKLH